MSFHGDRGDSHGHDHASLGTASPRVAVAHGSAPLQTIAEAGVFRTLAPSLASRAWQCASLLRITSPCPEQCQEVALWKHFLFISIISVFCLDSGNGGLLFCRRYCKQWLQLAAALLGSLVIPLSARLHHSDMALLHVNTNPSAPLPPRVACAVQ